MHGVTDFGFELRLLVIEVRGREARAGPAFQRRLATQDDALKFLGPPAGGHAQCAMEHFDDGIRQGHVVMFVQGEQTGGLHFVGQKKQRHVSHDLAGGRDLHDVAEQGVHLGVGLSLLGASGDPGP